MNRQQRRAEARRKKKENHMWNPTPPGGGRPPIQMPQRVPTPSSYLCPQCGDNPAMADNPQYPYGTPVAFITILPGEDRPTLHCFKCYQIFQAQLTRLNVPALRRKEEVEAELAAQAGGVVEDPGDAPGEDTPPEYSEEPDDAEG